MKRIRELTLQLPCVMTVLLSSLVAFSCASQKLDEVSPPADSTKTIVSPNYEARIEHFSAGETEYAGLYNNFEYKATLENSSIRDLLVLKQAHFYQWSDAHTATEREKSNQEMSSTTKVFLGFFTPNPKNDNLAEEKSIWRIYLDAGGRRYEVKKVTRIRVLLSELQALYPYVNRWTTPYELTFDVPTAAIEKQPSTLTITGPLGAKSVTFKALD